MCPHKGNVVLKIFTPSCEQHFQYFDLDYPISGVASFYCNVNADDTMRDALEEV
jgi:hypothetical protein